MDIYRVSEYMHSSSDAHNVGLHLNVQNIARKDPQNIGT